MSQRPSINKLNRALRYYYKLKGPEYVALKLAEECNELSQAIIKLVNSHEDSTHVLEEMAHVHLFLSGVLNNWDKKDKLLIFNRFISERTHRLILKTMPNKVYPARLNLGHVDDFQEKYGPQPNKPTIKVIGNEVYSYLTQEQYQFQMEIGDDFWRCPITGAQGDFDEGYYESGEDL